MCTVARVVAAIGLQAVAVLNALVMAVRGRGTLAVIRARLKISPFAMTICCRGSLFFVRATHRAVSLLVEGIAWAWVAGVHAVIVSTLAPPKRSQQDRDAQRTQPAQASHELAPH